MKRCYCEGWLKSMESMDAVFISANIHGVEYKGREFYFCPWCSQPLLTEEQKSLLGLCKHGYKDWSDCPDCGH